MNGKTQRAREKKLRKQRERGEKMIKKYVMNFNIQNGVYLYIHFLFDGEWQLACN